MMIGSVVFFTAAIAADMPKKASAIDPGRWVTNADYPAAAIQAGEQGLVGFRLDLGTDGRVVGCTITASSGSSTLDATTCRLLARRARFDPARDAAGRRIPSTFSSRFRWVLPANKPVQNLPGMLVIKIDLAPGGRIESCSSEARGKVPAGLGDANCAKIKSQSGSAFLKQQAASYRTIRIVTSISQDQEKFPIDGSGWGRLLQRRAGEIHTDQNGKAIRCVAIAAIGQGSEKDFCAAPPSGIQPAPGAASQVAHKSVWDFAVFAVPR